MKKILALILCALCVVTTAVACQKPEDSKFTLACPDVCNKRKREYRHYRLFKFRGCRSNNCAYECGAS